eukprot:6478989-Amphidinium_carterae.1
MGRPSQLLEQCLARPRKTELLLVGKYSSILNGPQSVGPETSPPNGGVSKRRYSSVGNVLLATTASSGSEQSPSIFRP